MRTRIARVVPLVLATLLAACATTTSGPECDPGTPPVTRQGRASPERTGTMQLGNFSVSLAVKDLAASRAFYEKLGFTQFGGDASQNWLIMKNGTTNIGLFQGMFPTNILTFNPGWAHDAGALDGFTDVRDLQAALQEKGVEMTTAADPASTGPASFVIADPDGNVILFDQHVPRPE